MSITGTALEQGQLVHLRNRYFIVEDVIPHDTGPAVSSITRVSFERIDDDRLGETLDIIWEREVNTRILSKFPLLSISVARFLVAASSLRPPGSFTSVFPDLPAALRLCNL
ncbi:MAG: hypothetical protein KAW14_09600 [Candidatus Aegiribacteria sp.]|nr:hypothetical protein [Candidatus Aegiribacteria sp.]